MKTGIYKITNTINNKSYIGQAYDIERRWSRHRSSAFNINSNTYDYYISRSFRKYGLDSFVFEIIEECFIEELNEKEIFYIEKYNTFNNGYNSTMGGSFGSVFKKLNPLSLDLLTFDLINTELTYRELEEIYDLSKDFISDVNTGKSWIRKGLSYPLRIKGNYCVSCGIKISSGAEKCKPCSRKVLERPDKETLITEILSTSMVAVGKKYGVSDNAVRKWLDTYGEPRTIKDLKIKYSPHSSTG